MIIYVLNNKEYYSKILMYVSLIGMVVFTFINMWLSVFAIIQVLDNFSNSIFIFIWIFTLYAIIYFLNILILLLPCLLIIFSLIGPYNN